MATQAEIWDIDKAEAQLEGIELYHRYLGCDLDCPCGTSTVDWRLAGEIPADFATP
jgi:hypothetical protein